MMCPPGLIVLIVSSFLRDEPPVPDPAALMKEVRAHQQKMDEVRENYTYHRIRRIEDLDGSGEVKKTTLEEHEIFYVNGHQIGCLVKREGKPLSAEEAVKEGERTRKLTNEFAKKPPSFGGGGGVNLIGVILTAAELSNPRRTEMNGRPTIAFDFKGDPEAETHTMRESAAKKLAGTVWIDEADRQVARLEVEFYDNFHIAGGLLASIQKGTVMKIDQSPIGEGLWMQTANERSMNMRVIIKGVHEHVVVRNVDFRRFNVDQAQHIREPAKN